MPTASEISDDERTRVLVLYTGGTIGMKNSEDGFIPAKHYIYSVLASLPQFHDAEFGNPHETESGSIHNADFVTPPSKFGKRVVYNVKEYTPLLDSCNMGHRDWVRIATDIYDNYADYDAFIVLHGTDTMAYTASALSFLLENLKKTVIVTGSQVPLSVPLNDAVANLLGALTIAGTYRIPEVLLYFCSKAFRGNRCIKQNASEYDAFGSKNFAPLVKIGVDYKVAWNRLIRVNNEPFAIQTKLSEHIAVFRLFPGFCVHSLTNLMKPPLEGLVLQTFGAGNAPDGNAALIEALTEASERGLVIVNCTQCPQGTVEAHYATGMVLKRAGVIPGQDMTVEAALTKLAYLLGKGLPTEEVREKMSFSLRGELTTDTDRDRFTFHDSEFINSVVQAMTSKQHAPGSDQQQLVLDAIMPVLMCSAAEQGMLKQLEEMVHSGTSVNAHACDNRYPLHLAAAEGHIDIVNFLLDKGADINPIDRFGITPLYSAVSHGQEEICRLLRGKGAELMMSKNRQASVLLNAVADSKITFVKLLLEAGINANIANYDKRTALHICACRDNESKEDLDLQMQLAKLLIEYGASAKSVDRFGETPVDCIRKHEDLKEVLELLGLGESPTHEEKVVDWRLRRSVHQLDLSGLDFDWHSTDL